MPVRGLITATNGLNVRAGASDLTIWLSPQMLDLEKRVGIVVNGRRINTAEPFVGPSIEVMLEDVRTRSDRVHPFWAKETVTTGRGG